ncbi:MAG: tetratricopeptide repeat protein [Lentisphaeria bacterium]|nr:tetratricopeptide repeat protein [Lentisphaeria bacterium]
MQYYLSLIFFSFTSWACINGSYTRYDEEHITNNELDLILGQFAHHGSSFYENEIKRTNQILKSDPNNFEARNDHAIALLKLERYKEAQTELLTLNADYPNTYKIHSNLGVLYKKMQRFNDAESHIQKALEIRPGGHMGLGDYYLKMIQWMNMNIEADQDVSVNFLGLPYSMSPEEVAASSEVNKEYLLALIKNDMNFGGTYFILGDVYYAAGNMQLAYRCYLKSKKSTIRPDYDALIMRLGLIKSHWEKQQNKGYVTAISIYNERQFNKEVSAAYDWLRQFQEKEQEAIENGRKLDFKSLLAIGPPKPKVQAIGYFHGKKDLTFNEKQSILFYSILSLLILYIICRILKEYKKNKHSL